MLRQEAPQVGPGLRRGDAEGEVKPSAPEPHAPNPVIAGLDPAIQKARIARRLSSQGKSFSAPESALVPHKRGPQWSPRNDASQKKRHGPLHAGHPRLSSLRPLRRSQPPRPRLRGPGGGGRRPLFSPRPRGGGPPPGPRAGGPRGGGHADLFSHAEAQRRRAHEKPVLRARPVHRRLSQ